MSETDFARCLPLILREEGGNDDDPNDHGGRTSRGIIQREYDAYRARKGQAKADVWRASDAEIREIYFAQYWQPWCDKLPAGLDLVYFDFAVNAGGTQASKALQRALGNVGVDGHMGIVTLNAVESAPDVAALIARFSEQRRAFYHALAQFPRYGRGWLARTARIEQAGLALAKEEPAPQTLRPTAGALDNGTAKANGAATAEPIMTPEQGSVLATGGTTGAAGIEGTLQAAQTQLAPLSYTLRAIQIVMVALVIVGLGFTLWGLWQRGKQAKVT